MYMYVCVAAVSIGLAYPLLVSQALTRLAAPSLSTSHLTVLTTKRT